MAHRFLSESSNKVNVISRNNNFDLIRLLAAMQVILFHVHDRLHLEIPHLMWLRNFKGVMIFFTISGFLITSSLMRNRSLKRYFASRYLRIYPALYILTFATIVAMLFTRDISFRTFMEYDFIKWIVSWFTIDQNYSPWCLHTFGIGTPNGSLWTIPVELTFYMVLPFVLLLSSRKAIALISIALMAVSIITNHYWHDFWSSGWRHVFSYSLLPYLYSFLLGGVISLYWDKLKVFFEEKVLYYLIPFLLFIAVDAFFPKVSGLHTSMSVHTIWELIMNFLLSAITISAAFSYISLNKFLKGNDISYGVYLYHGLMINLVTEITNYRGDILYWIVYVTSILCGYLSWRFIEKPALSLKSHFI